MTRLLMWTFQAVMRPGLRDYMRRLEMRRDEKMTPKHPLSCIILAGGENSRIGREIIPDLEPGAFAENLATVGIDSNQVKIGDKVLISDEVFLEVTQLGKKCHSGCEIQKLTGDCIMPKKGIFSRPQ